jgi:predicted nucleic acid-binding Zn ribbon protein
VAVPVPARPASWRELLGGELADRVAEMARANGRRPETVCVAAVRVVVDRYEAFQRRQAATSAARSRCAHPPAERSPNGRCKRCGATGLGVL